MPSKTAWASSRDLADAKNWAYLRSSCDIAGARYAAVFSSVSSVVCFFFSSRRRHTRFDCDWSSDVCSSDLRVDRARCLPQAPPGRFSHHFTAGPRRCPGGSAARPGRRSWRDPGLDRLEGRGRSEEHTSELQSQSNLVCRLLLEKKKTTNNTTKHNSPHISWRRQSLSSIHACSAPKPAHVDTFLYERAMNTTTTFRPTVLARTS